MSVLVRKRDQQTIREINAARRLSSALVSQGGDCSDLGIGEDPEGKEVVGFDMRQTGHVFRVWIMEVEHGEAG